MSNIKQELPNTDRALKIVIDGEREAVSNYTQFAKIAGEENLIVVSKLFLALAAAEKVHIKNHINALGSNYPVRTVEPPKEEKTLLNLSNSIENEIQEAKALYPSLLKSIKNETKVLKGEVAKLSMEWAMKAEKVHSKLLKIALKAVKRGSDVNFKSIMLCTVCGNVTVDESGDLTCKICGHDEIFFTAIL